MATITDNIIADDLLFIEGIGFRGVEECHKHVAYKNGYTDTVEREWACGDIPYGLGKIEELITIPATPAIFTSATPTFTPTTVPAIPATFTPPSTFISTPTFISTSTFTSTPTTPAAELPPIPLPMSAFLLITAMVLLRVIRAIS